MRRVLPTCLVHLFEQGPHVKIYKVHISKYIGNYQKQVFNGGPKLTVFHGSPYRLKLAMKVRCTVDNFIVKEKGLNQSAK